VIAIAYGAYEVIAVSCRMTLGGRRSAWDVYADARFWLACSHRMPWGLMDFLMEAERLGVLRRMGGVYQFRHIRLRQRLSLRHVQLSRRLAAVVMRGVRS